ncbi:type II CAAX endopeptidase family protein [Methanoculleus sp.]|uniref:CPBP family intramembrane glutamic endopeptidase n=1 Tax=Methanoculleus sp. TaxID=90427 RepID=UPI0025E2A1E7|nr:type II CAAX endopeptidase family protein [Methanoculleus sp.]
MKTTRRTRSVGLFFLLVYLLSLPVYLLRLIPPYSLLMVANPFIAASLLTCREAGWDGVRCLWERSFDYKRIRRKVWYIPLLLLIPAATILQYGLMRLMGEVSIPRLQFPLLAMPVYFVVFFVLAIGEEVGWSGYALDPLQDRWGALPAGIILGVVWALWHLVPYSLANPPLWVAGQCVATVAARILMVWLYNNTGGSVFGMILLHAMINMGSVPDYGFRYDPVLVGPILAVMAAVVVFLWGPGTLARYRYA